MQWAERSGQVVAWVSLDEQDNDSKVLLGDVARAQDAMRPVARPVFDALASPADDRGDQLEDVMVEPDRPGRPAVQTLGEPAVGGPLDRAGMLGLDAGVLLGLGLLSLSATSVLVRPESFCGRHVFPSGP